MTRRTILATNFALLSGGLAWALPSQAAPSWSAPVPLSPAGVVAIGPTVAAGGHGDATVVWRQRNASGDRVVASWRVDGGDWRGPKVLSGRLHGYAAQTVAMNARQTVVVWRAASGRVMLRQRGETGWTRPVALSGRTRILRDLDVAIDGRGDITVVWRAAEKSKRLNQFVVRAVRRLAGHHWSRATRLSGPLRPGHEDVDPVVAMGGTGEAVVLWQRILFDSDDSPTMISRRLRSSDHWRTPRALDVTQGYGEPLLAMNARGDAVASWTGSPFENQRPYMLAGVRPAQGIWHTKHLRPRLGGSEARGVALDADGNVAATWAGHGGSTGSGIQFAERPVGGPWEHPEVVSAPDTLAGSPSIAMAADGTTTLVWIQGGDADELVGVQRPPAGSWSSPATLSTGFPLSVSDSPLAVDADGNVVVAWVTSDVGERRVVVTTG